METQGTIYKDDRAKYDYVGAEMERRVKKGKGVSKTLETVERKLGKTSDDKNRLSRELFSFKADLFSS